MNFASLIKPSLQTALETIKNIDTRMEKLSEILAKELQLDATLVKTAFNKAMTQAFEQDEKKSLVCNGDGCTTKPKTPKEIDGKTYCSKCAKKAETKLKAANKTICQGLKKNGTRCEKTATQGCFCSQHQKSTKVVEEVTTFNGFNFATEQPISIDVAGNWEKPNVQVGKIGDLKVIIHKKSKVVLNEDMDSVGVFNDQTRKIVRNDDLSNTVKKWIYNCGIKIDYTPEEPEIVLDEDEEKDIDIEIEIN